MYSPPSSPSSARSPSRASQMRNKTALPHGFRPAPKPKRTPIPDMSLRELQDRHNTNTRLLASPHESTSADAESWMVRVKAEQVAVEGRLVELVGMDAINTGLKNTAIKGEDDMDAKRKALSRFEPANNGTVIGSLSLQEAIALEQRAHLADKERQERLLEKRKRMGMPIPGEQLTRQEREARMWAFMNHKPSGSDLEDDSEDEYDDEDPASWFEDDQDDGRKGQLIIEPDEEDYSDVIRIDGNRLPSQYSTFYEPRDDD
ncbi:hypothetical protein B0H16DRAFT_1658971 [Mycena metata]|uniref:Uncharacterized protein n=1 Tax=Mycena metata TaxID=1033252 RepID=A0AAD7KA15_9AGAR|nr:hypothetical protein B0H16DRAFT_1658971 [Mycena metata]